VTNKPLTLYQIANRLASKVGRAVETVHSVLRQHTARHPHDPLARDPSAEPAWSVDAVFEHDGDAPAERRSPAAARRTPVDAKRALLEMQVLRIRNGSVHVVDHELFHRDHADAIILHSPNAIHPAPSGESSVSGESALGAELSSAVMSPADERDAFCRYNYLKHKALQRARALQTDTASVAELEDIVGLVQDAHRIRDRIVQANLRLVVHVAKPFTHQTMNFFELISEGNVTLLRSVECFDFGRGFKFSTYLTHSLRRAYSKAVAKECVHAARFHTNTREDGLDPAEGDQEDPDRGVPDEVRRVLAHGLRQLTSRERYVVRQRFGFSKTRQVCTLTDIAARLGVSKERVRQLQVLALQKLRSSVDRGVMCSLGATS
jgi:RNA polymerase sigma factor (sigma-70 family)